MVSVIVILVNPRETIEAFDRYLAERGLQMEAVVLGGAALALLGIISRATDDCDVMHPEIPPDIAAAARDFAAARTSAGEPLEGDWFNNGPAALARVLPPGWEDRLEPLFAGVSLRLRCLGRAELSGWLEYQDANPEWPDHVRATLADLARRLGHGV